MPGSVRREEAETPQIRRQAAEMVVWYVVRMTMLLSTLISAEPWRTPRSPACPQMRKAQNWSVSLRNLFS